MKVRIPKNGELNIICDVCGDRRKLLLNPKAYDFIELSEHPLCEEHEELVNTIMDVFDYLRGRGDWQSVSGEGWKAFIKRNKWVLSTPYKGLNEDEQRQEATDRLSLARKQRDFKEELNERWLKWWRYFTKVESLIKEEK